MGGNAFANTRRLSQEEYEELVEKLLSLLQHLDCFALAPPEVADKAKITLGKTNYFLIHYSKNRIWRK